MFEDTDLENSRRLKRPHLCFRIWLLSTQAALNTVGYFAVHLKQAMLTSK